MADSPPNAQNHSISGAPYRISIEHSSPVELLDIIAVLHRALGMTALREFLPMQPGAVYETFADIDDLHRDPAGSPSTSLQRDLEWFEEWLRDCYRAELAGASATAADHVRDAAVCARTGTDPHPTVGARLRQVIES